MRITEPGRSSAIEVTLYLQDEEWVCDCDSNEEACQHAAAAVIALRRARKEGKDLPSSAKAGGHVTYHFTREGERLVLERLIVDDEGETTLRSSLSALIAGRAEGPRVQPTKADLTIDAMLERRRVRLLPGEMVRELLHPLASVDVLTFEGETVTVGEVRTPRATVEDDGKGYRLSIGHDDVIEVVASGIALCRGEPHKQLCRLAEVELTGPRLELNKSRRIAPDAVAEFVTSTLVELERRIEVDVRTRRLPRGKLRRLPPRIAFEVEQVGPTLTVLPLLVYGDPPVARIDNHRIVHIAGALPIRDPRGEKSVVAELRADLDLDVGHKVRVVGKDARDLMAKLRRREGAIASDAFAHYYPDKPLEPQLGQGADVRFASGDVQADAGEVVAAWQRGDDWVTLLGGGVADLPVDWLERYGPLLSDLLAARDERGEIHRAAMPLLAELCEALNRPRPAEMAQLAPLVDGFEGLGEPELPADLTATLRPYQHRGVAWLQFLRQAGLGAVLADDMGLGKTLQMLCAIGGRTLVVCPTSVIHNWADEIARFRPNLGVCVYHGSRRELVEADVTLTSYALLRNDVDVLHTTVWDCLVLDEAQAIKNPESQVAQAAYRMRASFRASLSGTPIENRLDELWSQFHFTNRGLLGGRAEFQRRYVRDDTIDGPRLRARIKPFVLRRLKSEVASELPPRTDSVLHCALSADERDAYNAIRVATQSDVVARLEQGGNVLAALEALLRLRQAACHTGLLPGRVRDSSAKTERLLLALEQACGGGHKSLVFSQWTSFLDLVEPHLKAAGIDFVRLDGSTRDREGVVNAFQTTDVPVILLSLKAGGTGLNLTAADHVFLLDPWWNPAVEDQAADRAHRIGQDKPVMVYRLVAKDTVEERILELQEKKRRVAEAALGEADGAVGITRDDLISLLS